MAKIIYGITKSNFGGAQRYVFDLARGAKKQGHDVAVICGGDGMLIKKLEAEQIRVIHIPSLQRDVSFFGDLRAFFFILKTLRKEKPDVFHVNSSKMGGIGALAGRLAHIKKVIFTGHGWAFNEDRSWLQRIIIKKFVWYTIRLAHKTICVSKKTRVDVSHWPFIQHKIVVIPNGIESFPLVPRAEARIKLAGSISPDTLLVGALSELHRVKGLDILLASWAEFMKNHKGLLVIAGEGNERKPLEHLIEKLGIQDSVRLLGFVENARSLLSGLDILVLPSRSEAFPFVPLEAGLARTAIIATRVGGVPEIIENKVSGFLVPPENPTILLSALSYLADNKDTRQKLGDALYTHVSEHFSLDKMVRATLEAYV